MSYKQDSNTKKDIKQNATNVNVSGNISNSSAVIIGSNIRVEGGISVTTVIQEIESFGLNFLRPDYFQLYKSLPKDFVNWKNGFPFKLPNIMDGLHYRRIHIINWIINKLDDNNGNHALLLLGKSGSSKSILLMDIMCHYFRNGYNVFYNFGEEEIKDVYDLEISLTDRLKDGNKILVAVDNVHDKRTAAIFSVIDSLRSYEEKKDNICFILTGRLPEFDRLVYDRLDTLSEPVRQSIQNIYKQISHYIPNFTPIEIQNFLERYGDEDDVKRFVNENNFDYNKLFIEKDEIALNNISSLIYEQTKGDPTLVKFFIFGRGFAPDVESRFFNYLGSDIKLQSMLACILLDRAVIPISSGLIEQMNLKETVLKLTDETLTFLEDEDKWKTIHPKWDLELLAYLYNIKDYAILDKRKNLLRKTLELLMNNLSNENDRFSIFGSLYDSTTIDTEENQKFPITIVESVVTSKTNLIHNNLNEYSRYDIYGYYITKNYYYLQLYDKSLAAIEEAIKIYPNEKKGLAVKGFVLCSMDKYEEAIKCFDEIITKLDPKDVSTWLNKGVALGRLGQYEEEIKCYDEITKELDPKNVDAWLNKGAAYADLGQCIEAKECFDEIINKSDPNYVDALNNKGRTLDKLKRYQEAIDCYNKALEIDPNNKYVFDSKGYTLTNLGKYDEAIDYFNKALSIDRNHVSALGHKKIAEERLQNRNK